MKKNKGENVVINNLIKLLIIFVGLVLQVMLLFFLYGATSRLVEYANIVFEVVKIVLVIYIIYKPQNDAYKIIWIILILFVPVLGFIAYLLWGNNKISKRLKAKISAFDDEIGYLFSDYDDILNRINDSSRKKEARYLSNVTNYGVYCSDGVDYFSTGEEYYRSLKESLIRAKKYILMEFFIVSDGMMWKEIYEILKSKSSEGVDIYLIYDSLGSLFKKPSHFHDDLNKINVKYLSFNPLIPLVRSYINYRNHRKIVVVDGLVAYTGGINIGDEYINLKSRVGYWKDCGIRVTGECVKSFVAIFFEIWNISKEYKNFAGLLDGVCSDKNGDGFIIPYSDQSSNRNNPSENTYINIINNAKGYVYIMTPYLILDSEIESALVNASLSGIDVRIVTPFIPDKKLVNACTKSFYGRLLEAGIKIYEYKPGFVHSKVIVSDDCVANVGTVNFDFRSFYLNYECGVWIYNTGEEIKIRDDILNTIDNSFMIELETWKKRKVGIKILEAILRVISPLL